MTFVRPSHRGPIRAQMLAALAVVAFAASALAVERQAVDPAAYPRIVNGVLTHDYPAVGAVLRGDFPDWAQHVPITADSATSFCSGTLIGCSTFLTAGHCTTTAFPPGTLDADEAWVYLPHAGIFPVTAIARHPDYALAALGVPINDVAVLTLGVPVTGIAPLPINLADPNPFIPAAGTIVGFGSTNNAGVVDKGLKRIGPVETATCVPVSPDPATQLVCWDVGEGSDTGPGDSGGPLLLDLGDGPVVAGVTSGGTPADGVAEPGHSFDANVYTYRDFILAELGSDDTTTCGGLPPVGDPQVHVSGFDGSLDDAAPSASHTVTVGAGAASVRVTVNAEETVSRTAPQRTFDANLYVKAGPGASPTDFDCAADAASVFGACVLDQPTAGTYSIFVERAYGAGDYQVTATVFGGAAPVCGDGHVDLNEECDDGNAIATDGCTNACTICGNGTPTPPEACDDGNRVDGDACTNDCRLPATVVGDGTAASCTVTAFPEALGRGRVVRFQCGPEPVSITLSSPFQIWGVIAFDTTVDGGGLVTLAGNPDSGPFAVNPGITFTVKNLTIANGGCPADTCDPFAASAIFNRGAVVAIDSTFADNRGVAIANANGGTLTVANSVFSGSGQIGIFNFQGAATVTNSTFFDNSIVNVTGATLVVTNTTVAVVSSEPAIATGGTVTVRNTIVANGGCGGSGTIADGGHNIDSGMTCGFSSANGSLSDTDPALDSAGLADHGGPTQTIALLAGSPAIGAGDPDACANPPVNGLDQRGYVRPGVGHAQCSIGAYEADAISVAACVGDCDGDGGVAINELIIGVNIALGERPAGACPAFANPDGMVDIARLVTAVNNALDGCGSGGPD